MDSEGETALPVHDGKHLKENYVGAHYPNYDFTIILSHFKGHAMGRIRRSDKKHVIGIASSTGKGRIHSAGKTKGTRGKTCLHKTISWNRWPKPPNRWLNIAVRKSFI